jgi:hypothetical protein
VRKRLFVVLIALIGALPIVALTPPASASAEYPYSGPYFGANNLPPGCVRNMSENEPANACYHMRTGLNALDSPKVDVLVMVPVSATAERDARIMRQSIEMWEAGIDYLADRMELDWLSDGMDFHITVDTFDPAGDGGEFTTYPIVDPEIVVIATNPVGGIGIGVEPVSFGSQIFEFMSEDMVPCHNVTNPFDFEYWENLPGFDSHHESRSGTYTEDCGGGGGNICFAINGAIDPDPRTIDFFGLFDLVSHEVGHCLTIGHVGDGAEGSWGPVPTNDIMAYSADPPNGTKCVSTLDVEGIALRMSRYLDANGDGEIDERDHLHANDQFGDGFGGTGFQVQHPRDHLFASSTGLPTDCPQPDLEPVPGARTNWTPSPTDTSEAALTVTSPVDGASSTSGVFQITGKVEHRSTVVSTPPTSPTGSFDDADDDASTPVTEILSFDTAATATHVDTTIHLAEIWPSPDVSSPVSYSVTIDGRKIDSFVRYPVVDGGVLTWDGGGYLEDGASTWDTEAKTVSFHISRAYLANAGITSPYEVSVSANLGSLINTPDDLAPETGETVGIAASRTAAVPLVTPARALAGEARTVTFEHEDDNTFYPDQSELGTGGLLLDAGHYFALQLPETSDITFELEWTDATGGSDLDLSVSGARYGSATSADANPEILEVQDALGVLDIRVSPSLVTNPMGVTYTLTAHIVPDPDGDGDSDGFADPVDACPMHPGIASDGCSRRDERVVVYVDGTEVASQHVETIAGADTFAMSIVIPRGTHEVTVVWDDDGKKLASRTLSLSRPGGGAPPTSPPGPPSGDPRPGPSNSSSPPLSGYWMVAREGTVFAFGDARWMGNAPVGSVTAVDVEATPTRAGYWVVDAAGHVFSFGDAAYFGGSTGLRRGEEVTSMSATPSGKGYWLFTTQGRALALGDAKHHGDMSGTKLNGPVLDSIPTPSGNGYYMVASDGGVFTFGDASFAGSMGATRLNAPVQSLVPDADGAGYWLVASDGGIFAFDADFFGSMGSVKLNQPVTGMVGSRTGRGYLMVAEDGGIFTFGDVVFRGSLGASPPPFPIASVTGV